MAPSEAVLLLKLVKCANQNRTLKLKNDALGFVKAVKVAFEYKMRKYDKFLKVLRDFKAKRIHISGVKAKLKRLFKGHKDLISGFNNLMPEKHRITTLSFEHSFEYDASAFLKALEKNCEDFVKATMAGKKKKKKMCQLPWDMLDVISQKLDFDDLFRFACVCKNWRDFHKSNFMASQEPLLVEIPRNERPYSFSSLTNQKVYPLEKMMKKMMAHSPAYITYSSGYFIMAQKNNSFLLFNPFTRINKVIYTSTFEVNSSRFHINNYRALLAFEKCSEEFVLLVLCNESRSLHVYQSRNNGWFTYSNTENIVVDFAVLHNIIYVVTNKANIGVLNLNSGNIKFLTLKNTPTMEPLKLKNNPTFINLVNCDEQLLLVDLTPGFYNKSAYKIDLSSMSYVILKTLGDIALFYVWWGSCKALSSPNRWGYKSNSVYQVSYLFSDISEYNWDERCCKCILPPRPKTNRYGVFDWCFRHLKYQVDYSLLH